MYGAKKFKESTNGFEHVIQKIDEGQTGLLLIAEEEDNRPLNQLVMFDLGGEITLDLEEVNKKLTMRTKLQMKQTIVASKKNNIKKRHRKKNKDQRLFSE